MRIVIQILYISTLQGSIEDLIQKLGSNDAMVQQNAAEGLKELAWYNNNYDRVKIGDAGAIPPLVALLGPHSSSGVQEGAATALCNLAANNSNKVKIMFAGGVDALTQLMQSTTDKHVKWWAKDALDKLK